MGGGGLGVLPPIWGAGAGAAPERQHALGDLLLGVKARLLPAEAPAALAVALAATLPTAVGGDWAGETGATLTPALLAEVGQPGGARVVANVGYHIRPRSEVQGLAFDDEVRLGVGAVAPLGLWRLAALAEVEAALGVTEATAQDEDGRLNVRRSPAEARGALRWCAGQRWAITAGAGYGLTSGYGAPDLRALMAVAYAPQGVAQCAAADPGPSRGDDSRPGPPGTPPPPPDPPPAPGPLPPLEVRPLSPAAFDALVDADPDPDGDGLPGEHDACPERAEDKDGHQDEDGCPDNDNDGDGVADAVDRCPAERETINGLDDEDGCPDEGAARVMLGDDRLKLEGRIFFRTASDELQPRSEGILRQVAQVLRAGLSGRRVQVEGHTDSQGNPERNVDLSERRARRVMSFLIDAGVPGDLLMARGYGPARPLTSNDTAAGRRRNRRVEFRILKIAAEDHP